MPSTFFASAVLFTSSLCLACSVGASSAASGPPEAHANRWSSTPVIGVSDVNDALEYYCKVLQFRCDSRLTFFGVIPSEGPVYAVVTRQVLAVHLQIRRGLDRRAPREGHEVDLIVKVEDVDALFADFSARGVHLVRRLPATSTAAREFTLEDPFGNRLTFSQWYPGGDR